MAAEPSNKNFKPPYFDIRDPVTSYGILLFHRDPDGQIWYLLSQRRDTIEYADFLRGRYSLDTLETYFSLMTIEERKRLDEYTFDELWDDLWINHDNKYYNDIKAKAVSRYEANQPLKEKYLAATTPFKTEPGWGFPKGRKNPKETELQCAFREFKEETRLHIDYRNLLNLPPSKEIFKGSNGRMYSTVYYVSQTDTLLPIIKIPTTGIRTETISEEVSNLRWCILDDALKLLPPWRQKLLIDAETKIITHIS